VPGRQARGGASPLHVQDHAGDLGHGGQPQHLHHQAQARSRGGRHGTGSGVGGPQDHSQRGDLVFGLDQHASDPGQLDGQELHHVAGRGDRIACEEAASRCQEAQAQSLVAVEQHPGGASSVGLHREESLLGQDLPDVVPARVQGLQVAGHDLGPFVRELLLDQLTQDLAVQIEEGRHHPDGHHVLGQSELQAVAGDPRHRHGVLGALGVLGGLEAGRVVDQQATWAQIRTALLPGLFVEGHQHVQFILGFQQGDRAQADLEGGVTSLDLGGVGLGGQDPVTRASGSPGDELSGGQDPLSGLSGHPDLQGFLNHRQQTLRLQDPTPRHPAPSATSASPSGRPTPAASGPARAWPAPDG